MRSYPKSVELLNSNKRHTGRNLFDKPIGRPADCLQRSEGAYLVDVDGNRFIDYHAAFAPHFLGHNDPWVTEAVERVLRDRESLYGSGATILEGRLAEQICGA